MASDERHCVRPDLMLFDHIASDDVEDRGELTGAVFSPGGLVDNDQAFLAVNIDREGCSAIRLQSRVALFHRPLDVLWVMVFAADDDEVTEAPSHIQMTVFHDAEVTGAEVPAIFTNISFSNISQVGMKSPRAVRPAPIPARNARALNPDFTNLARPTRGLRLWVSDHDPHAGGGLARTDKELAMAVLPVYRHRAALLQREVLDPPSLRVTVVLLAAHQQSGFGEAIARVESLAAKPARPERGRELVEDVAPDRFGAIERDFPITEVYSRLVLVCYAASAKPVRRIWTGAHAGSVFRDCLQPAGGTLQESHWRHEDNREAAVQRVQNAADEAHVVVRRKP